MVPDDFAAFRATHPAPGEAIAGCPRPDWLIQIAWDAGIDRRAVVREGSDAARLLRSGAWWHDLRLFWPVPRPLEAVDRWAENPTPVDDIATGLRPSASAVVPGVILGGLVAWATVPADAALAITAIVLLAIGAVSLVLRIAITVTLRRRVARLDEDRALAIVLAQLRLGMSRNPGLVPRALVWLRRGLSPLIPS